MNEGFRDTSLTSFGHDTTKVTKQRRNEWHEPPEVQCRLKMKKRTQAHWEIYSTLSTTMLATIELLPREFSPVRGWFRFCSGLLHLESYPSLMHYGVRKKTLPLFPLSSGGRRIGPRSMQEARNILAAETHGRDPANVLEGTRMLAIKREQLSIAKPHHRFAFAVAFNSGPV